MFLISPADEQSAIAAAIHKDSLGPSAAMERSRREVALIREFHSPSIADVVTGKLDVREAANFFFRVRSTRKTSSLMRWSP